ncbi:MAG: N-acetylmuramoyl-L-alanine amidase, partial [Desulfobacteraceae bacterium]|nr:N-acetylmuramoyl-L-alanine amidase [Desulfobacteraceae bacterium]
MRPGNWLRQRSLFILTAAAAFCLLVLTAAAGAAAPPDPIAKQYQQAVAYYNNLAANSARAGNRDNWLAGVRSFKRLAKEHPEHELAPSCLYMLGRVYRDIYHRFGNPLDLGEAIGYFQDVVILSPDDRLADDALFNMAEIDLKDKKDKDEAARTFARIVAVYPNGDMAAPAAEKLEELKHESPPPAPEPKEEPPVLTAAAKKDLPSGPAHIQPIRYWSTADYTRVVIEADAPVAFEHSMLPRSGDRPRRLFIDLQKCRLRPGMEAAVPIRDGLLKQVRIAQNTPDTVRVVLDIESIADYKVFNLQNPFRVVIDARGRKQAPPPKAASIPPPMNGPALSLPQQLGMGIRKVVIDPGHGGKDPGAIGPGGIKEKDIVLAVAKKVGRQLEQELGCQVVYTRDRDVFIPLEERTAIANTKGGDLFISIHANAAPSEKLHGVETYYLSLATNKDEMQVAARENASSTRQISDLQSILKDLLRNTKVNESAKLAAFVQKN